MDLVHLDGMHEFTKTIESYGYIDTQTYASLNIQLRRSLYEAKGSSIFREHLLAHITLLAQSLIILVTTTIKLATRFVNFVTDGLIKFKATSLAFAFVDLMSVAVQMVVLPILGIIATFSPKTAANISKFMQKKFAPEMQEGTTDYWSNQHAIEPTDSKKPIRKFIASFITKVLAPIQLAALTVAKVAKYLLNFSLKNGEKLIKLPFQITEKLFYVMFNAEHTLAHGYFER